MAEWEPGDDICPPWWPWHGPRPPWWDDNIIDVGQQVFIGLTLVNAAARVKDAELGLQVARLGSENISKRAGELHRAVEEAGG